MGSPLRDCIAYKLDYPGVFAARRGIRPICPREVSRHVAHYEEKSFTDYTRLSVTRWSPWPMSDRYTPQQRKRYPRRDYTRSSRLLAINYPRLFRTYVSRGVHASARAGARRDPLYRFTWVS